MLPEPLYLTLWFQPGACMDSSWWHHLGLQAWQTAYEQHAGLRPVLDQRLGNLLAQQGPPPEVGDAVLLSRLCAANSRQRCVTALGLQALGCADYLLRKPWRQALAGVFTGDELSRLQLLLPPGTRAMPTLAPSELAEVAERLGAGRLAAASEPFLSLFRLLWPLPDMLPARQSLQPLLTRIVRWM
ncbi:MULTISPECIES: type III secretion system domain-containing protein [unclassified Paludibacterium]|uniref:type III secretion system domain-containing protein n=1 Tax=unclassified Paludibacterium TaxID=2618429 RepID=UPI001C05A52B|nr:type III secretion system domain-containing protein [Paludibacterium sp. B53371]BEV73187.1 hypothetical protein THUN1379_26690 [Paludibacterium sp. THUN1379]